MGQEAERAKRLADFAAYQVNGKLMRQAPADAVFMHCLPARRGEEVTDEVIDGPQSVVVAQAANRMHVQKGILVWLLGRAGLSSKRRRPQRCSDRRCRCSSRPMPATAAAAAIVGFFGRPGKREGLHVADRRERRGRSRSARSGGRPRSRRSRPSAYLPATPE